MWKQFVKDFFSFTAKERKAVVIIVCLVIGCASAPLFYSFCVQHRQPDYSYFAKDIARLTVEKADSSSVKNYNSHSYYNDEDASKRSAPTTAEVFYFDPNTASFDDWKRLGIREKTIHTIQNYLSKGGKFYKPGDIKKIWGLSPADAERLLPYVSLKDRAKEPAAFSYEKKEYPKTYPSYPAKTVALVDINLADTTAWIGLPGIGSKLSQRIVAFRNKLGGFYSVDQVGETYALPDCTFQKIKPRLILNANDIKKININTATADEMKMHPYLRYNIANAIYQYRLQHGNYAFVDDIKKIMLITEDMYKKWLRIYLFNNAVQFHVIIKTNAC